MLYLGTEVYSDEMTDKRTNKQTDRQTRRQKQTIQYNRQTNRHDLINWVFYPDQEYIVYTLWNLQHLLLHIKYSCTSIAHPFLTGFNVRKSI